MNTNRSHNKQLTPTESHEQSSRGVHTHADLLHQRSVQLHERSLNRQQSHVDGLKKLIAGDSIIDNEYMPVDMTHAEYERDYAGIEAYFCVTPLSDKLIEVRPVDSDDFTQRQGAIRDRLAQSPFRERLGLVVSELEDLLSLAPGPGDYELSTRLDDNDRIDHMVATTLMRDSLVHIEKQADATAIIISIHGETAEEASSYLNTDSAKELLRSFDDAGMRLSHAAKEELTLEGDSRYGNSFAWLSRESVKSIAGHNSQLTDEGNLDKIPEYTDDLGANLVIDALRQVALRGEGPYLSDIPVTRDHVALRDKGCKDVETYFSQSAAMPGTLQTVQIGDKSFWHKTHGGHTYLNLEEVVYNGVELPPGYLFKQSDDGGFALLRATGFAFDKAVADQLFGSGMTDSYQIAGDEAQMQATFDMFAAEHARVTAL